MSADDRPAPREHVVAGLQFHVDLPRAGKVVHVRDGCTVTDAGDGTYTISDGAGRTTSVPAERYAGDARPLHWLDESGGTP